MHRFLLAFCLLFASWATFAQDAAADMDAGHLLHLQHLGGADGDDGGCLHDQATGFCGVPCGPAADHLDAPVTQRGFNPGGAA